MISPRVLLAEDHQLVLAQVTALLRPSFDVVGTASNGQQMVSEALRLEPDVIVADVTMPIMTGIAAAHQLRESGSNARIVFLTVHSEIEFMNACIAEGALGYVLKSRMRADLIPAISAALAGQIFISARRP